MGSGLPCCVDYWRAVNRLDPPREFTERERLLLAAHREANNIWASAQLGSPHHTPVVVVEWCVCASALGEKKKKKKQTAATSNQQKFWKNAAIWSKNMNQDEFEKYEEIV